MSGTPAVAIALDPAGGVIARRTYRTSGGPTWICHYYGTTAVGGSTPLLAIDLLGGPVTPAEGELIGLDCVQSATEYYQAIFEFDPTLPFGTVAAGAEAALRAREELPLAVPGVVTSPPLGRPQLAGLATWLSVDTAWEPVSASATLAGVTATVTATPDRVEWDPGDGAPPIVCAGPGAVFDPARPDAGAECAHTYVDATGPGRPVALRATVTWSVAWTATDGSGDVLDPVTRSTTVAVAVQQAQALVR